MPYQSLLASSGAAALTMAWKRSPMTRSASGMAAILASTAFSSSAALALALARFASARRSFMAAFSSAVRPAFVLGAFFAGVLVSVMGLVSLVAYQRASWVSCSRLPQVSGNCAMVEPVTAVGAIVKFAP